MENRMKYYIGGAFAFGAVAGAVAAAAAVLGPRLSLPEGLTLETNKKYKVHRKLGRGVFGIVYLVEKIGDEKFFALKTIANNTNDVISGEPKVMKSLRHINVTHLYDLSIDNKNINMVMDYMRGGNLQDRLSKTKCLPQPTARLYFLQLCEAINYLHKMNITHRDLKPDNILLASDDENTLLKVSDFGLSRNHVEYYLTSNCGTKLFMAPEYWKPGSRYNNKVDIWSAGIILYVCISGEMPFYTPEAICDNECMFDQSVWESYKRAPVEIIKRLLAKNPASRPKISDILELPWLNDDNLKRIYAEVREDFKL